MSEVRVILLCGSRFALPAMQEMYFFKQLQAVAIPAYAKEMIGEVEAALKGSDIGIIVLNKNNYTEQLNEAIGNYQIDTGIIMTFPYKIPSSIYSMPGKGFFNVHPGPLPEYRGADPVFQQIINKEARAGVTIHKLDEEFDTGEIVVREMIRLENTDTYGLLNAKLAQTAALMVRNILKIVSLGMTIHSRPQDASKARYFKRQTAKDIGIDWNSMDAASIITLINACNPWNKGAVTKLNGKILRLLEGETLDQPAPTGITAGTIVSLNRDGLDITTSAGELIRVRIVYTDEGFFNSERLKQLGVQPGAIFEPI